MSPDWLLAGGLVASLPSSFCVRLQLNFTSPKSLQVLHPNIGGLRTLVTSKVTALTCPLWCTGIYS